MPTGFNVSLVTLFPQLETGCCSSGSLNEPCVVKWCLREPRLMLLWAEAQHAGDAWLFMRWSSFLKTLKWQKVLLLLEFMEDKKQPNGGKVLSCVSFGSCICCFKHQISTGATLYPPKDAIKLVVPSLSSSVFSLILAFLLVSFLPVLV